MQITIKTTMGTTIFEEVAPSDCVQDLKKLIANRENIPCEHQRLSFAGVQLESERKMRECGIQDKSTLHMTIPLTIMTSPTDDLMQINVWIGHLGKAFRLSVDASFTLDRLMATFQEHGWLHWAAMALISEGRYLEGGHTLQDYDIRPGDWMRLSPAEARIYVRSISGDIWLEVCVPLRTQLNVLAEMLMAKRPGQMFSFMLTRGTTPITDMTRTLISLGLEDGGEVAAVAEEIKPPQAGWCQYRDEVEDLLWWHNEIDGNWFLEFSPDPWVQYQHPDSDEDCCRTWWWNSETHDWFDLRVGAE